MTGTPGFVEFFVLEAGEYIEQIDGILLAAGANQPDAEALQRLARGLRGSATMAKLSSFAGLAAALERVGRALREGELHWDQGLRGALVASVDDLKTLLRSARSWSPDDDRRAGARTTELTVYAPPRTSGAFRPIGERSSGGSGSFLGNEASNIAAGLELLTTRPGDGATAANVLGRIRALRGVAEVKDVGPLSQVLEASEDAAHGLESGQPLSAESQRVLETATAYLRAMVPALRGIGEFDASSGAREQFSAAVSAWSARTAEAERVVPIAELFYEDGSPGVLDAAQHPPTSAAARFHLELVSLAEHLSGVLDSATRAFEPENIERARREAVRSVHALEACALSFGEHETAARIGDHLDAAGRLNSDDVALLKALADSLSSDDVSLDASTVGPPQAATGAAGASGAPSERMTQTVRRSSSAKTPTSTPSVDAADSASAALLDSSIAALDQLTAAPMISPTPIPEDVIVPIETLLYRGRAALDRAVEVRDELRRAGSAPDPLALEELFDLVELARAE